MGRHKNQTHRNLRLSRDDADGYGLNPDGGFLHRQRFCVNKYIVSFYNTKYSIYMTDV